MRFFKVSLDLLPGIYMQVKDALAQPNPRADEPFPESGDFNNGETGYLALGDHHCEGEFALLIAQFIVMPGVQEIPELEYRAAAPPPTAPSSGG